MKRSTFALGLSLAVGGAACLAAAQEQQNAHEPKASDIEARAVGSGAGTKHPITSEEQERLQAAFAPAHKLEKEARDLFEAGRLEEAEQKCRESIALNQALIPEFAPLRLLGDIQLARRDYKGALESYGVNRPKSMRHIPGYPELCIRIAQCYLGLGDIKAARKFYAYATARRTRLESLPGAGSLRSLDASLLLLRGLEVNGWPEQALRYYQAAGKLAPENWSIVERTADTLYWLKRYDEAMPYYRRLLKHQGERASYDMRMRVEMYDIRHGRSVPVRRR